MPTPTPIAVTLFRRPEYTRRLLAALDECYGLGNRYVYLSIDWNGCFAADIEKVCVIASRWAVCHPNAFVIKHTEPLGIDLHKEWLINALLELDFESFIFLEDDIIPAPDALRFFDWALATFQHDAGVLSACAYAKTDGPLLTRLYTAHPEVNFCPWGWAMWADRWLRYWGDGQPYRTDLARWYGETESPNGHFDYWWLRFAQQHQLQTVFPDVARTQNIGRENGVHTRAETFDATDYNPIGAWLVEDLPDHRGWQLAEAKP